MGLKRFFLTLISVGISSKLELRDVERIRLVNIVSIVTIGLYLYYIAYGIVIGSLITSAIPFVMLLLTLVVLYLNFRGKHALAKTFIFGLTVTSIWFTHQVFVGNPAVLNFFYPVLFCFTFFFKLPEEKRYFSVILVYTVYFIVLSVALPKHLFLKIDQGVEIATFTNKVHFIFSIVVTVVILVFAFRNKRISDIQIGREVTKVREANQELERAQMKLVESDKMASLGMLISGINHEINNPLNFIRGSVTVLKQELPSDQSDSVGIAMNAMDTGVDQLCSLVKSLNHFSHRTEKDEEVDIHDVIDNCVSIATFGFKNKASISRRYHQERLVVFGNSGRLQQVLLNLITNAQQAMEEKGKIDLVTSLQDDQVIIEVNDTGKGIGEDTIHQIFDPFFTTKAPGEGTGLGLSISYNIIKDHHGDITVTSKKGVGTSFKVMLPLHRSAIPHQV